MHCSLLVFLLRFVQASYLTTIMGHRAKKKSKNVAKPGNDHQKVARDKSTQQYEFRYKAYQTLWHKTLQKLPSGQIIDIPYLKQLEIRKIVPIAYFEKGDIDTVTNFVPRYLAKVTRRLWDCRMRKIML